MKISVIIPLYNKEHYIRDTIQSVLSQTFTNWEAIIINDGSTDNSESIAKSFHDNRIRVYSQDNQGVSKTRNRAIQLAQGDYIAFLDADDEWKPAYLETMINLARKYPEYSVFCTGQQGRPIHSLPSGVSVITDHCSYDYIFWTGAMLVKKAVFDKTGGFREGIQLGEDRDMWLRIGCIYPTIYLNEELVSHPYITENNLARTIDTAQSFPYWEWYNYPYPNKKSLFRYTTNQIVICAEEFVSKKRYSDAWSYLKKTRGLSAVRPRLKLLLRILLKN